MSKKPRLGGEGVEIGGRGECWRGSAQPEEVSIKQTCLSKREGKGVGKQGMTWWPLVEEKLGTTRLMFSLTGSLIKRTVPTRKCVHARNILLTIFREIILYNISPARYRAKK